MKKFLLTISSATLLACSAAYATPINAIVTCFVSQSGTDTTVVDWPDGSSTDQISCTHELNNFISQGGIILSETSASTGASVMTTTYTIGQRPSSATINKAR